MYHITALGELLIDFTESGVSKAGMKLFEQNPGGAVNRAAPTFPESFGRAAGAASGGRVTVRPVKHECTFVDFKIAFVVRRVNRLEEFRHQPAFDHHPVVTDMIDDNHVLVSIYAVKIAVIFPIFS